MKCFVQSIYMNIRYRVLHIDGQYYILDMGGSSLWKILFPFLYWMFPLDVYQIDDHKVIYQMTSPYIEEEGVGRLALIGGSISFILGNSLYPLVQFLDIAITPITSAIIMSIIFVLILTFILYSNTLLKRKMRQHIHLEEHPKKQLLIRPSSKQHFIGITFNKG